MLVTRSPNLLEKLLKIRWGQASGMFSSFSLTSCLSTTFSSPKQTVGPTGKWQMIMPSGTPRCSCSRIRSDRFLFRQRFTRSCITYEPLLMRSALGIMIAISLRNCIRREEGSLEVVRRIWGSEYSMLAYSSSMWLRGMRVFMSSAWSSCCSFSFSRYSSVGSLVLFCWDSRIFRFFYDLSLSSASLSRVQRYSRRCLMFFLSILCELVIYTIIIAQQCE